MLDAMTIHFEIWPVGLRKLKASTVPYGNTLDRSLLALRPSRHCAQARSEEGMPFHTQSCKEYTDGIHFKPRFDTSTCPTLYVGDKAVGEDDVSAKTAHMAKSACIAHKFKGSPSLEQSDWSFPDYGSFSVSTPRRIWKRETEGLVFGTGANHRSNTGLKNWRLLFGSGPTGGWTGVQYFVEQEIALGPLSPPCYFASLLKTVPDPKVEAVTLVCLRNGGLISWRLINLGSMKLILTEIGLVKISTSVLVEIALPVLVKVIPPIEIVSIISLRVLNGWKTWRSKYDIVQELGDGAKRFICLRACSENILSSSTSDETA
ncbi:hypothetical protein Tco_0934662 [Tanacetum coccineum]